ncbi:MAG: hypothetical protein DWH91_11480 [Planctomycetota bacterium]|nr:MAG: hypothetical protein DWH91_11480 [Planctomycetota bacterium]
MSLLRIPPGGAWVGPFCSHPLGIAGWTPFESMESFLAHSGNWSVVVFCDSAGLLREADFQAVWPAAPFARIIHAVGPYRSGINRTDPQWPRATTWQGSMERLRQWTPGMLCDRYVPPTPEYTEVVAPPAAPRVLSLRTALRIADPDLRAMWSDTLRAWRAPLVPLELADLIIFDADDSIGIDPDPESPRQLVGLTAWPWWQSMDGIERVSKAASPDDVLAGLSSQRTLTAKAA